MIGLGARIGEQQAASLIKLFIVFDLSLSVFPPSLVPADPETEAGEMVVRVIKVTQNGKCIVL